MNLSGVFRFLCVLPLVWSVEYVLGRPATESPPATTSRAEEDLSQLTDFDPIDDPYFDAEENEYADDIDDIYPSYEDLSLMSHDPSLISNSTHDHQIHQSKDKTLDSADSLNVSDQSTDQDDLKSDKQFKNVKRSGDADYTRPIVLPNPTTNSVRTGNNNTEAKGENNQATASGSDASFRVRPPAGMRTASAEIAEMGGENVTSSATFHPRTEDLYTGKELESQSFGEDLRNMEQYPSNQLRTERRNTEGNIFNPGKRSESSIFNDVIAGREETNVISDGDISHNIDPPVRVGVLHTHSRELSNITAEGGIENKENIEDMARNGTNTFHGVNRNNEVVTDVDANIVIPRGGYRSPATDVPGFHIPVNNNEQESDISPGTIDSNHENEVSANVAGTNELHSSLSRPVNPESKGSFLLSQYELNATPSLSIVPSLTFIIENITSEQIMAMREQVQTPKMNRQTWKTEMFVDSANIHFARISTEALPNIPTVLSDMMEVASNNAESTARSISSSFWWVSTSREQNNAQHLTTSWEGPEKKGKPNITNEVEVRKEDITDAEEDKSQTDTEHALELFTTPWTASISASTTVAIDAAISVSFISLSSSSSSLMSPESTLVTGLSATDMSVQTNVHYSQVALSLSRQLEPSSVIANSLSSLHSELSTQHTAGTTPIRETLESSGESFTEVTNDRSDSEESIQPIESTNLVTGMYSHSNITGSQTVNSGNTGTFSLPHDVTNKPGHSPRPNGNVAPSGAEDTDSPSSFMELRLSMSWVDFCRQESSIRGELVEILQDQNKQVEIRPDQIQLLSKERGNCFKVHVSEVDEISVRMYLTNKSHQFDRSLTLACANTLLSGPSLGRGSVIGEKLLGVRVHDTEQVDPVPEASVKRASPGDDPSPNPFSDPGITLAVTLAVVGGCCCAGLIVLQIVARQRSAANRLTLRKNRSFSVASSDSIQLSSVIKSRPSSGIFNPGLDMDEQLIPTNPLNFVQLSKFCMDENKITEEYQKLPNRMPRLSVVPPGEEDKNRYANILPLTHSRVQLQQNGLEPRSSYINANYITGPNKHSKYYIATQAPTEKTVADFWTMVWQQQCKAIVMLTQTEEDGQVKCVSYWPELVGKSAAQRHGDFLIELKQKDVHQEYIASVLEINNLREIETRQVDHFWYTCWPVSGVPEPISLVKLVLDTRPKYESGTSPLVVHCSPGTGRTGTFIALDLCMHQFETKRVVDVARTVYTVRQERAGAVQNKEQYKLLYSAIQEYATVVVSPVVSAASSATTLHALLPA